jgi:hypothetical protein
LPSQTCEVTIGGLVINLSMNDNSRQISSIYTFRAHWIIAVLIILGLGLAIRLYDLTDLPLDFHPTRQLLSAIKARGMYYETRADVPREQQNFAVQQWKVRAAIEPEVFERLVAFTYRFTGEQLWMARIFSSLFWVIGAGFLFLLARELVSVDGALTSMAIYLFLPYGVIASRSFQPDPLMVMLIIMFWWAVVRWSKDPDSYKFAVLAGLFGGLAIFIKFVAAFFVIGGALGVILGKWTIRQVVRKPQLFLMLALGMAPGTVYLVYGVWVAGYLGQQFGGRFIPALFFSPAYYLGWVGVLNLMMGGATLMLALFGLFFLEKEKLRFMLGLWAAYALFGIYFNYHVSSHDYYSLPLIPIVALSFGPLAEHFFSRLAVIRVPKIAILTILFIGIFSSLWGTRAVMKSVDYRPEADMWVEISESVGERRLAGLTRDYGASFAYWGWKALTTWPTSGDINYHVGMRDARDDFEAQFAELTLNRDLFLVTDLEGLKRQPLLEEKLQGYPIFAQGDGYLIYDLGQ